MRTLSNKKKSFIILISAVLILVCAIGATLALLRSKSDPAVNQFAGSLVNIAVLENGKTLEEDGANVLNYDKFSASTKKVVKTVQIKNVSSDDFPTSETYVRARLVPVFRYASGEDEGKIAPVDISGVQYEGTDEKWKLENGYYYYTEKIEKNTETQPLITAVNLDSIPDDVVLELQVLVEGISAKQTTDSGETAANTAWNVNIYK